MHILHQKVKVISGYYENIIGYCTYTDGIDARITPVNGDSLDSISLKHNELKILDINDCQCFDKNSKQLNQCNECPR